MSAEPSFDEMSHRFESAEASWVQLVVPPRRMWTRTLEEDTTISSSTESNERRVSGGSGAAALQSVALYFGTWITQRAAPIGAETLLGEKENSDFVAACSVIGLTAVAFPSLTAASPQVDAFLNWTQSHLYQGHPVVAGFLGDDSAHDYDYNHIAPIIALHADTQRHSAAGDNAFWTNVTGLRYNDMTNSESNLLVDTIAVRTGAQAEPDEFALPIDRTFGVAVTGVRDDAKETYRTKLTAWSWTEPDWGTEDKCNEAPQLLNLSVCVYGLTAGESYTILRFDGNASVPTSNFAAAPYGKRWDFVATAATYVQSPLDTIWSNTVASYRTIRTSRRGHALRQSSTSHSPKNGPVVSGVVFALACATGVLVVQAVRHLRLRRWSSLRATRGDADGATAAPAAGGGDSQVETSRIALVVDDDEDETVVV